MRWIGVVALIWLFAGAGVEFAIGWLVPELLREYFVSLWIFCGWLGPAFILAVLGLERGNRASKICGIIVLVAFAIPLLFVVWAGIYLRNH